MLMTWYETRILLFSLHLYLIPCDHYKNKIILVLLQAIIVIVVIFSLLYKKYNSEWRQIISVLTNSVWNIFYKLKITDKSVMWNFEVRPVLQFPGSGNYR
jgi:hypothetical protein